MDFLNKYYKTVVKYDFINKFHYKLINKLPIIKSVTLSFNFKKFDIKLLISALTALELLTLNKGILIKSKVSNVSLKVRKGQPVGCKITLRKHQMNQFLFKILNKIIINQTFKNKELINVFSIKLENILIFEEFEKNYRFFKNLSNLNITIKTTACNLKEFIFLITSFKFFNKNSKNNSIW